MGFKAIYEDFPRSFSRSMKIQQPKQQSHTQLDLSRISLQICGYGWPFDEGDEVNPFSISSFRESRSDIRRFCIFTATKTLQLRCSLKEERATWSLC
ncbi:putative oxysterol-binding protein [Helianthus debilis subsp. tardiflorus]